MSTHSKVIAQTDKHRHDEKASTAYAGGKNISLLSTSKLGHIFSLNLPALILYDLKHSVVFYYIVRIIHHSP